MTNERTVNLLPGVILMINERTGYCLTGEILMINERTVSCLRGEISLTMREQFLVYLGDPLLTNERAAFAKS